MKKTYVPTFFICIVILGLSLACGLPGSLTPSSTDEIPKMTDVPTVIPTETEEAVQSPSATITESGVETEEPISLEKAGQISYIHNGNLWRYLIDSGETIQVTKDSNQEKLSINYGRARFSFDGRYLAFNMGNEAWIQDFENGQLLDVTHLGHFFTWRGEGTQFYSIRGDLSCPEIDDLDDQVLINFDILWNNVIDLEVPTIIANIAGGLRFLEAISPNGEWASVVHCGCYSECGGSNLWHLPTLSTITPPPDFYPGHIDFSPDGQKLTVSQIQMYGYVQSPLYVANTDYTQMVAIFDQPNTVPLSAKWSPNGDWIAFTSVDFAEDEFTEINRCVRLIKPDGTQEGVVECQSANLVTWSPNSDQLLFSRNVGNQEEWVIYDLETGLRTLLPIQVDPYTSRFIDWGRLQ